MRSLIDKNISIKSYHAPEFRKNLSIKIYQVAGSVVSHSTLRRFLYTYTHSGADILESILTKHPLWEI